MPRYAISLINIKAFSHFFSVFAWLSLLSSYRITNALPRYAHDVRPPLHGQVELLALHDLSPVDVEEVGVEDGLDEAGDHGDWVEVTLHCVPAD